MYTAALSELVDLATRFRHAAVPYVYLKGFSISAAAAADPLAREMADLDFLVPADDLQSAHKILAERDYVPNEPVEKVGFRRLATMTHHEAVYCSPSAVLPVELHWRLSEVRFMRSLNVGLFHLHKTERMIAGNPVTTLSNAAMTLLCALHGARHFWFRLKWVADFAALISILSDADQEELISISKQAGCLHVVSAGIELTQDLLGIDMPPFTSALLKERDTKRDELAAIWLRMCQPGPNGRPRDPATIKRAIRLTSPGLSTRIRWRFFEWVSPDFPLVEAFPHAETRLQVPTAKLRRRFRRFNLLNRSSDPAPDFQALQEDLPRNGDKSAA